MTLSHTLLGGLKKEIVWVAGLVAYSNYLKKNSTKEIKNNLIFALYVAWFFFMKEL